MRVIAGSRRHLVLKTTPGMDIRPTTDRTKETLFNVLQQQVGGSYFLDLFSGTGAIGIEAFSRGARKVVLVEQAKDSIACIKDNLHTTKSEDEIRLLEMDVFGAIKYLEASGDRFDIIFMDPPYDKLLEKRALEMLSQSELLAEDGLIVVEASKETDFSYLPEMGYSIYKEKVYKNNMHLFIKKSE